MRALILFVFSALNMLVFQDKALTTTIEKECHDAKSYFSQAFPDINQNAILCRELKGGLSGTALYKIDSGEKSYVLRIYRSPTITDQDALELSTLLNASEMGITPKVIFVSADKRAIVMEFINQKTATIEQAKAPDTIVQVASALRKTHQLKDSLEGESLLSKAQRCYNVVSTYGWIPQQHPTEALALVKKYSEELQTYTYLKVPVHGDLNPRNVFITPDAVLFIDWSETKLEDPFYDLSFFALKMDYSAAEESLLTKNYLQRLPTVEESNRYNLHKKIHQAFWSLTNLYLAEAERKKQPHSTVDLSCLLKSWTYYQKTFADNAEELTPQYFYELSQLNLEKAKT